MNAAFHTFGCRLNQLETEALADAFRHARFSIVSLEEEALVYVINTCTVTSKSEQKARGIIRRLSRDRGASLIIVTGCYAQMEEDLIDSLGHNVFAVPLREKDLIQDFALYLINRPREEGETLLEDARTWFRDNRPSEESPEARFRFVPGRFYLPYPGLRENSGRLRQCLRLLPGDPGPGGLPSLWNGKRFWNG